MKATQKYVLFARHNSGKQTITYPVAVFSNLAQVNAFKLHANAVHASGDTEAMKKLLPGIKLTESGTLHDNVLWSPVPVVYNPEPPTGEAASDEFVF